MRTFFKSAATVVVALVAVFVFAPNALAGPGDWDAPPAEPPGLGGEMPKWVGYAKYVAIGAGIIGIISCGIMMMIGRRNRSHLAAEGAAGLLWTFAGISVAVLAAGIVPAMMGA